MSDIVPNPTANVAATAVVSEAVARTLNREDVPIKSEDVGSAAFKTTGAVMRAIQESPDVAVVPVQSPLLSKVNWTQLLMLGFTLLAAFGVDIPPETKLQIIEGLIALGTVATVIFKTFFTKSITTGSK